MKYIVLFLITILSPYYLLATDSVTDQRVVNLCKKIGIQAELRHIKNNLAAIKLKDKKGYFGLYLNGCDKNSCTNATNMQMVTLRKNTTNKIDMLKKINIFNQKLLFARVYLNGDSVVLTSDFITNKGVSDITIINYLGAFLASRDEFFTYFK